MSFITEGKNPTEEEEMAKAVALKWTDKNTDRSRLENQRVGCAAVRRPGKGGGFAQVGTLLPDISRRAWIPILVPPPRDPAVRQSRAPHVDRDHDGRRGKGRSNDCFLFLLSGVGGDAMLVS